MRNFIKTYKFKMSDKVKCMFALPPVFAINANFWKCLNVIKCSFLNSYNNRIVAFILEYFGEITPSKFGIK